MDIQQRKIARNIEVGQFADTLTSICGEFEVALETGLKNVLGHVSSAQASGLDFAFVGQNAAKIIRSARNLRQDPGNHFFLIVQDEGSSLMRQGQSEVTLSPGDMFLVDSAMESEFVYEGHFSRQFSLHLPRDDMHQRYGRRIEGGIAISRRNPLGQAMRSILREVLRYDDNDQPHVSESFYSVFGAFLLNRSIGQDPIINPDQLLYNRALNVMTQNFRDSTLGVPEIAASLGVSTRKLQRVFKLKRDTPRDRLQRIRIDCAARMILKDPRQSISSIAYSCGFNDLSTFHRQYRSLFGKSPSTCRVLQ